MSFISSKELQGVIIVIFGYMLISGSINTLLGSFILPYPYFLIPGAFIFFITSKFIIRKIPFLSNENTFIGQTIHIVITLLSYSIFIKSITIYLDPWFHNHTLIMMFSGLLILLYAVKFHLTSIGRVEGI